MENSIAEIPSLLRTSDCDLPEAKLNAAFNAMVVQGKLTLDLSHNDVATSRINVSLDASHGRKYPRLLISRALRVRRASIDDPYSAKSLSENENAVVEEPQHEKALH